MSENYMIFVWLGLTVVFALLEAASAQLTTIWFALGSVVAFVLALCGVKNVTVQIIVFLAVSLASLILTRPFVKKILHKRTEATNADRNVGEIGITLSEINNLEARGEVKVNGSVWTARSKGDEPIPAGVKIRVVKIDGVKLIVETAEEPAE